MVERGNKVKLYITIIISDDMHEIFYHQIKAMIIFKLIFNFVQRRHFKTSLTAEITIAFKSSRVKLRFLYNLPIFSSYSLTLNSLFWTGKDVSGYSSRNSFFDSAQKKSMNHVGSEGAHSMASKHEEMWAQNVTLKIL
jgi:hypothetical protein